MIRVITRPAELFDSACQVAGNALILVVRTGRALRFMPRRRKDIVNQAFRATYGSLPVTMLTALFSGMILAFQSGVELARFGQEASIGYVVSASMVREMGAVMTAIAMAGLMGSSYAAEIGTMRVSEEIDALEVMSIDPVAFLVMPRVLAMVLASVALTVLVDFVGVLGGAMVGKTNFNVSFDVYFDNAKWILDMKDIWLGLVKAALFAMSTAFIGCNEGLRSGHGAEGVGRATQRTVVLSFIFVLVIDHVVNWFDNVIGQGNP